MTRAWLVAGALAGLVSVGTVAPAWSHHSHAMFDHSKPVTLTGTVTEFVFRNPHVFLYVDVKRDTGDTVNHWIEMSNIPNMIRRGIGQATFKPGDQVTMDIYVLKDGRPGGSYVTITAADGKIYQ